jgi:hypothetical protein
MQEIHGKSKNNSSKSIKSNHHIAVSKLLGDVREMLTNSQHLRNQEDQIKTD